MKNFICYNFSDFTLEKYVKLLRLARQKYVFRSYTDFNPKEKFIIWRHDVDYSMHAAVKLSLIEAGEGIYSTYFFYLHSEVYNLLEAEITAMGRKVLELGHRLGLHFNCNYYKISNESELEQYLCFEKELLSNIFNHDIQAFSFHNPTPDILEFNQWQYAGMVNTYADFFQKEVGYCSDSNGYWRCRRLENVLLEGNDAKLQVLTHPEWWRETIMSPKQRIHYCIDGRARKNKIKYDAQLRKDGRQNIDWD